MIDIARTYLGTPFAHQGRMKRVGIDCLGLVVCVARETGLAVQDFTNYPREPDGATLVLRLSEQLDQVADGDERIGDVLCFWIRRPALPCHVGFKTDVGVLHTYANAGKVVEHVLDARWQKRIHSVWRFREAA
jgi:cell wall-associated NlpC family hydrolase